MTEESPGPGSDTRGRTRLRPLGLSDLANQAALGGGLSDVGPLLAGQLSFVTGVHVVSCVARPERWSENNCLRQTVAQTSATMA